MEESKILAPIILVKICGEFGKNEKGGSNMSDMVHLHL